MNNQKNKHRPYMFKEDGYAVTTELNEVFFSREA